MLDKIIRKLMPLGASLAIIGCSSGEGVQPAKPECDPSIPLNTFYIDNDGDGYGRNPIEDCKFKPNYSANYDDCNDNNSKVNPKATEICDGIDNDCNGITDEKLSQKCITDCGDGLEICVNGSWDLCTAPQPSKELCNNIDDDCDGQIDEGLPKATYFQDDDGDGDGDPTIYIPGLCKAPKKHVRNALDCDDTNPAIKNGTVMWSRKVNCKDTLDSIALGVDDEAVIYVVDKNNTLQTIDRKGNTLNKSIFEKVEDFVVFKKLNNNKKFEGEIVYILEGQGLNFYMTSWGKKQDNNYKKEFDKVIWKCFSDDTDSKKTSKLALALDGTAYVSTTFDDYNWENAACSQISLIDPTEVDVQSETMTYDEGGSVGWAYRLYHLSIGKGELVYAIDEKSGETLQLSPDLKNEFWKKILVKTNFPIVFGKDNDLFVTSIETTGKGMCTYSDNGKSLFNTQKIGVEEITPVIDEQGNFFLQNAAYTKDGKNIWINTNKTKLNGTAVASKTLYQFGKDGLQALDKNSGKIKWILNKDQKTQHPISPSNLSIDNNGRLYFCNSADNILYSVCAWDKVDPKAHWPMYRHDNQRTNNSNTPLK